MMRLGILKTYKYGKDCTGKSIQHARTDGYISKDGNSNKEKEMLEIKQSDRHEECLGWAH